MSNSDEDKLNEFYDDLDGDDGFAALPSGIAPDTELVNFDDDENFDKEHLKKAYKPDAKVVVVDSDELAMEKRRLNAEMKMNTYTLLLKMVISGLFNHYMITPFQNKVEHIIRLFKQKKNTSPGDMSKEELMELDDLRDINDGLIKKSEKFNKLIELDAKNRLAFEDYLVDSMVKRDKTPSNLDNALLGTFSIFINIGWFFTEEMFASGRKEEFNFDTKYGHVFNQNAQNNQE